jgi:hypothetical protein
MSVSHYYQQTDAQITEKHRHTAYYSHFPFTLSGLFSCHDNVMNVQDLPQRKLADHAVGKFLITLEIMRVAGDRFEPTACGLFNPLSNGKKTQWTKSASKLYRPTDRRLLAKLVPTFADRRSHVVSVTDPIRPYSRISRQEPLLFLPSSSSIVLTTLSGPRSRPTTSQKIW